MPEDKYCCISGNNRCRWSHSGRNCSYGTSLNFDEACHNECPKSNSEVYVAISSSFVGNKCSKNEHDLFYMVDSGDTEDYKDFKEYCFDGEDCKSSVTNISFKQCYTKPG